MVKVYLDISSYIPSVENVEFSVLYFTIVVWFW
jgi:hypothetical protein